MCQAKLTALRLCECVKCNTRLKTCERPNRTTEEWAASSKGTAVLVQYCVSTPVKRNEVCICIRMLGLFGRGNAYVIKRLVVGIIMTSVAVFKSMPLTKMTKKPMASWP